MNDTRERSPSTVSSPEILGAARRVRALQWTLEAVLAVVVVGSVLAFGSVHEPAYRTLWIASLVALAVALVRAVAVRALRERVGAHRVALHRSRRWLVIDPRGENAGHGWSINLRAQSLPHGPLLLPGLAMAALAVAQLVPLFGGPATLSPEATRRGLAFVLAFVAIHHAAAAALMVRAARQRLRRLVAWLGALLAFVALAQAASGTELVYGFFAPYEGGMPFGPFVNRNHFAGYMLLVIPVALCGLGEAWQAYRQRLGLNPNTRRRIVTLATNEGSRLLDSLLPALASIAALFATTSRGAILAFFAGLVLAAIGLRARRGTPAWAAALVFVAVALAWFGLERLEVRFARAADDRPGRTVVWNESLALMKGPRWATGYGLDAYADALSRVPAWALPEGATPWPPDAAGALLSGAHVGYRAPDDLPGLAWYREAHNDWLQLLVETGLPGLLIGLWAALAALRRARHDPWLFAALAGVLLHCFVDFDMQIPAIPALFVVLAALPLRKARREDRPAAETEGDAEESIADGRVLVGIDA